MNTTITKLSKWKITKSFENLNMIIASILALKNHVITFDETNVRLKDKGNIVDLIIIKKSLDINKLTFSTNL
jgi:hypothetical protein